jgi:septum formation protein
MLRGLAGKKHAVYTGLALWDRRTGRWLTGYSRTDVWMKRVGETWLQKYVDSIHPFDKAGAYAIQGRPRIVNRILGSYSNVVGLPKELLRKMLKEMERESDAT